MSKQQKLFVSVEKQEQGYGLHLQLNSMPLDFIVQTINKIEMRLKAEEECANPLLTVDAPFPMGAGMMRNDLMESTRLLPQGKIINGQYWGDAYCVKCKEKRNFVGRILTSDSGRRMAQGRCDECGTKLNRVLGKDV